MSERAAWRQAYDAAERVVAPPAEAFVRTSEFARLSAVVTVVRRTVGRRVGGVAGAGWHLLNLPANTDVQRLRAQVGSLDRDVRRLTLELQQHGTRDGANR